MSFDLLADFYLGFSFATFYESIYMTSLELEKNEKVPKARFFLCLP